MLSKSDFQLKQLGNADKMIKTTQNTPGGQGTNNPASSPAPLARRSKICSEPPPRERTSQIVINRDINTPPIQNTTPALAFPLFQLFPFLPPLGEAQGFYSFCSTFQPVVELRGENPAHFNLPKSAHDYPQQLQRFPDIMPVSVENTARCLTIGDYK